MPWRARAVAASLAVAAMAAGDALAQDRSAAGLIVQLHDDVARRPAAATGAEADSDPLRRVLRAAGLAAAPLRPVGRSAQLVDFGRRLSADEAQRLAAALREHPEVAWVVPNVRESRLDAVSDPLFPADASSTGQWWLFPVAGSDANDLAGRLRGVPGIQSAWAQETGAPGAVVAVLDTGITPHPDLEGHVLPGHDFVADPQVANDGDGRDTDPSDPGDWVTPGDLDVSVFRDCAVQDSSWHGTVVAGMIAAASDNGVGGAGINRDGRVVPVRVAGKCGADVADIVDGMRWAAGLPVTGAPPNRHPARIVNVSFGSAAPCNPAYQSAIDEIAAVRGAVVVAAAGNERGALSRPASCAGVVAVTSLNRDGFKATYANLAPQVTLATVGGDPGGEGRWGPRLGDGGLLAPGNTGRRGIGVATYRRVFGTSFAAPIAAGVASLMLSVNPALSAAQLVEGLRRSARPHVGARVMPACSAVEAGRCACTAETCGAGILDAPQALAYARDPAAYVPPAWPSVVLDNADIDDAVALGPDVAGPDHATQQGGSAEAPTGGGGGAVGAAGLLALAVAALARRRAA